MPDQEFAPFMREALSLAEQGRWHACPNPTVGAVLVREGRIVARGWHHAAGQPHAEVECLRDAAAHGVDPAACTLVVTLEPCRHEGRTPPCTEAILKAGIRKVVLGLRDPHPQAGGGADVLRAAGVEVLEGVCQAECSDLVADFLVWQRQKRPFVLLKMAATLDGRIATRNGHSQWISSEQSRREVHRLRAGVGLAGGAVLIGGGTFRADNPSLTAHEAETPRQPLACVLTSRLPQPDADVRLLRERPAQTIFLASPAAAASTTAKSLRERGVRVVALGPGHQGCGPDFTGMLQTLWEEFHCRYVLCEGGGRLALSLLEAGLVDEFFLHLAPLILGDDAARPLFSGRAPLSLEEALRMRICHAALCGGDTHLRLRPAADNGA